MRPPRPGRDHPGQWHNHQFHVGLTCKPALSQPAGRASPGSQPAARAPFTASLDYSARFLRGQRYVKLTYLPGVAELRGCGVPPEDHRSRAPRTSPAALTHRRGSAVGADATREVAPCLPGDRGSRLPRIPKPPASLPAPPSAVRRPSERRGPVGGDLMGSEPEYEVAGGDQGRPEGDRRQRATVTTIGRKQLSEDREWSGVGRELVDGS